MESGFVRLEGEASQGTDCRALGVVLDVEAGGGVS